MKRTPEEQRARHWRYLRQIAAGTRTGGVRFVTECDVYLRSTDDLPVKGVPRPGRRREKILAEALAEATEYDARRHARKEKKPMALRSYEEQAEALARETVHRPDERLGDEMKARLVDQVALLESALAELEGLDRAYGPMLLDASRALQVEGLSRVPGMLRGGVEETRRVVGATPTALSGGLARLRAKLEQLKNFRTRDVKSHAGYDTQFRRDVPGLVAVPRDVREGIAKVQALMPRILSPGAPVGAEPAPNIASAPDLPRIQSRAMTA